MLSGVEFLSTGRAGPGAEWSAVTGVAEGLLGGGDRPVTSEALPNPRFCKRAPVGKSLR